MAERRGLLVMAYGTPRSLADVEAYYTDIRRGHPPPAPLLEELTERYRAIGGSPLYEITRAQAAGLEERTGMKAYVGQKHAPPFISDAIRALAADGVRRAVGLVLAPHYSRLSIGDYAERARRAADAAGWTGSLDIVESWHLEPGYLDFLERALKAARESLAPRSRDRAVVVFSAHSLPARRLSSDDPYAEQVRATAEAVAGRAGIERWRVAWQSAGRTADPWLGPDIIEVVGELAAEGARGVVICPCGFVADHLEVLYDVDIEAKAAASAAGVELVRTTMPNDEPGFLDTLAGVVVRRFESG